MNVGQVMRRPVWSCHPDDSLNAAAEIMWDNDCGCVPVTDGEGRLAGMITDRDVCMAAYLQGGPLRALRVYTAMAKEVFSCRPEDTTVQAEVIMREHRIRRLPAVDGDGRLVGLLSLSDIANEAGHAAGRKRKDVSFAEVGATLGAVCKPRRERALATAA